MDITFLSPCLSAASPPGKPARLPEGPGFFFEPFLPNLKDRLGEYDGVLCSFGLTAFEARRAGVPAILVSPSLYHHRLAKKGGFPRAGLGRFSFSAFLAALVKPKASPAFEESPDGKSPGGERSDEKSPELPDFLRGLLLAFPSCPGCGASKGRGDPVIGRFPERTYHRCRRCGLVYVNLHRLPSGDYGSSYFEEDYRRQYGRTYLEDFPQLRRLARERLALIESLLRREKTSPPALLDIGCAYGAFLVEAARRGFKTGGVDMSPEAAAHVRGEWGIPVWAGPVEQWEPALALGTEGDSPLFDVVASWYTLEHLKDPGDFLNRAVQWLKPGGILALSTPNLAGVSGRFRRRSFLLRNPADHYTLWTPRTARRLLAALGCPVRKVRITGHHPERFPLLGSRLSRRGDQGGRKREGTLLYRGLLGLSRVFALGDTFEVYAVKEKK
ncbi:MAG: class I SAM-dependent methyltransferase [Spirochaetales bacterium]|nr:class I SAM-dependent methyltransferase [Spirochaetales bacterium]